MLIKMRHGASMSILFWDILVILVAADVFWRYVTNTNFSNVNVVIYFLLYIIVGLI